MWVDTSEVWPPIALAVCGTWRWCCFSFFGRAPRTQHQGTCGYLWVAVALFLVHQAVPGATTTDTEEVRRHSAERLGLWRLCRHRRGERGAVAHLTHLGGARGEHLRRAVRGAEGCWTVGWGLPGPRIGPLGNVRQQSLAALAQLRLAEVSCLFCVCSGWCMRESSMPGGGVGLWQKGGRGEVWAHHGGGQDGQCTQSLGDVSSHGAGCKGRCGLSGVSKRE